MEWPSWGEMFVPDVSLVESFLRGSLVYLVLVVMFRVILKRQAGSLGLPDVMLVVLVSECVSQALTAQANSIPNGLAAVAGLLFWNYTLDKLSHRWPWLHRRLEPQPLELVRDGKPIRENLDRERISNDELEAQLRLNGVDDITKVKSVVMESEGAVSVIQKESGESRTGSQKRKEKASGGSEGPPELEGAAREFAAAARALQKAIDWHDAQAGKHGDAAKAARKLLKEHGVQTSPATPRRHTTRRRSRAVPKGTKKSAPAADTTKTGS